MVKAIESCERVLVPSEGAIEQFLRCGVPSAKLQVEPNVVDKPIWLPPRRPFDPSHVRVGVLGSVQPSKGVLELARWVADLGEPFSLEVYGPLSDYHGDESYGDAFRSLLREEPRVRWHGTYGPSDLPLIFAGLDLVCVPSLWEEVFGLVAYEAALAGLPVFVTDRGGLQESPGHALAAGDADVWKGALKRFVEDKA